MKIICALVYMLLKLDPEKFKVWVVYEKVRKVIYVVVIRAIYVNVGCIVTIVP